ncbi:hypothetical protein [Nocardiopsis sp. NRRL B-16309]|uniref:hypothetical protein n=1 Tax=Nocardiopsis sp. NRRL B-16309 TaxID=1519494 RepID=UPI0006AFAA63|nr:hypothetical protein [Nocardiopsis sp. NRRL B-16309]KOX20843.1 hypothetical protein ADL05_05255 [Nocardiopsis sp. NRRL B-16309]
MADPATIAIATAAATGLATVFGQRATDATMNLVNKLALALSRRFGDSPEAQEALVAARFEGPEQARAIETVAEHLERAERSDSEIADLVARLRPLVSAQDGSSVTNHVGDVGGHAQVVQAGDIGHIDMRRT